MPGGRTALLCLLAVLLISVLDGLTTGGVVVGILLVVPIIAVSYTDRPAAVWLVFGAAWLGFLLAATFGQKPLVVPAIALPNRVFVMLTLGASAWAALQLQRRRVEAQQAAHGAIDAREVNRLLMALIAHDLRAPLATALHTFDYLDQTGRHGDEAEITGEVRGRLRRSLRIIDAFLAIGGPTRHATAQTGTTFITGIQLATILAEEVRAFEPEAQARAKRLEFDAACVEPGSFLLNVLILRQTVAILVDNAVRYAVPGPIRLRAATSEDEILLMVEDAGPGLSSTLPKGEGVGLGLDLCGALVRRSGGELEVVRDRADGTVFTLRLPIRRQPEQELV